MDEVVGEVYVNQRGARENLTSGDVIDGIVLDKAVEMLKAHDVEPLVGQFYVLDLPIAGWHNLFWSVKDWTSLSPGLVAAHQHKPIIATYNAGLDRIVKQTHHVRDRGVTTATGILRGKDGAVEVIFAVM